MYKDYFSLNSKVFDSHPKSAPDFTGSQQAEVQSRLTQALSAGDTIITLTGPVGSGKTTLVQAALTSIPATRIVARIARIQLRHDEVLELLLAELGIESQPAGTIQRFTKLKQLFREWQDQGKRVFIVVEDAQRIGPDALSELESLTSADSGGASGASIVLMGLPELDDLLSADELTRTRQRVGLKLSLEPFGATEVQEYLAHCFAAAGGKVDDLLESGAADMIFRCTGGSPRVINKLGEAVLTAAARAESRTVSPYLVQQVAANEFGMKPAAKPDVSDVDLPPMEAPADEPVRDEIPHLIQDTLPGVAALTTNKEAEEAAAEPAEEPSQRIQEPQAPEALIRTRVDPASVKELDDALRPDTQLLAKLNEQPPTAEDVTPVPLGLQDQLPPPSPEPDQEIATGVATSTDAPAPTAAKTEMPETDLPTLSDSMRIEPPPLSPATENTSDTQTLKRPNIKALESALANARKGPLELDVPMAEPVSAEDAPAASPAANTTPAPESPGIPEITLDSSLEKRQQEAEAILEANKRTTEAAAEETSAVAEPAEPAEALETEREKEEDKKAKAADAADRAKLDKLAADLGSAKSLEEIDDVAAETLFGEEFSQMAAAVAAMAAADSANDADMSADVDADVDGNAASDDEVEVEVEDEIELAIMDDAPAAVEESTTTEEDASVPFDSILPTDESPAPDINASASRRFAMLRAMNEPAPVAEKPATTQEPESETKKIPDEVAELPAKKGPQVEPIENQFGSSMTQTLEALKFERPASAEDADDDDDDEEDKSGGFLSRFKRS